MNRRFLEKKSKQSADNVAPEYRLYLNLFKFIYNFSQRYKLRAYILRR